MGWYSLIRGRLNDSGVSLVELIIAIGIGGVITLGVMSMFKNQSKLTIEQEVLISRLDLERPVIELFEGNSICTFLLTDSTQSATATPPNRSTDSFNATTATEANPAIIEINKLPIKDKFDSTIIASIGKPASSLSNKLIVTGMKFKLRPVDPPDLFVADFEIEFNQPLKNRKIENILVKNIQVVTDKTTPNNNKKIAGCGIRELEAQRIVFISSGTWKVPLGVTKVFVTMAGGGGSGLGWRVVNSLTTGNSGGYVFSQPVSVKPGETMQVIVGKGGKGYGAYNSGVPSSVAPYFIYKNPSGDDGLGGYPGESSKLVSPTFGTVLECAGGSGAIIGGVDNYSGSPVAGNMAGANTGSGTPSFSSPNRVASGPYAVAGEPGRCGPGPSDYGKGNPGNSQYNMNSGLRMGGRTPFGRGSGGDVSVWGCYVDASTSGTCIFPDDGRDGVVYIDIW